ncbi:MAG: DEAD/DEAH box helicase [Syntrophus sp. (in: bacteria)]
MKIIITNHITITGAPESLVQKIRDTFTIENPAYLDNAKMGRWQGRTDHWLRFFKKQPDGVTIPRGTMGLILFFCKEMGIRYQIIDQRWTLPELDFIFSAILKGYQQQAANEILGRDFGVLQAPTGSGKTVIALSIIAARRQPCLIMVHSKELMDQWIERIEQFLCIPKDEIGIIGNGKMKIGERITVGIINSIYPVAGEIRNHFGHVVVDECHRCPSRTFTEAVSAFDCKFMMGLSATPYRRDGLTKLIGWHLGRKIEVEQADLTEADIILDVEVIARETMFASSYDASEEYTRVLSELTEDADRNQLIAADVIREATNGGGICLVLTDRREHCHALAALITPSGIETAILTGEVSNGSRKAIVERLNSGGVRVLIATGQLIGEGFDCKGLSTLFLACPVKFSGRLIQYLGRILRPALGKDKAKVYDYCDVHIGVLASSARARQQVYRGVGRSNNNNITNG